MGAAGSAGLASVRVEGLAASSIRQSQLGNAVVVSPDQVGLAVFSDDQSDIAVAEAIPVGPPQPESGA